MKKLTKILSVLLLTALLFTSCNKAINKPTVEILNPEVINPTLELPQTSWKTFWKHFDAPLYGGIVKAFAFDPNNPKRMLIALKTCEIYETTDAGASFKKIGKIEFNLPCKSALEIQMISISPGDSNVVYVGTSNGIFKSNDNCASWIYTSNGLSDNDYIRSIYIYKDNPNIVFASGNGLYKSEDGGQTWYALKTDFYPYGIVFDPIEKNVIYAFNERQIYKSVDSGKTWSKIGKEFDDIIGLAIAPSNNKIIYAFSRNDIFVSKDGGKTFNIVKRKEPEYINLGQIAIIPLNPNFIMGAPLYYKTSSQALLYLTSDGGVTWKGIQVGEFISQLMFGPENPQEFYILTSSGNLFKSPDFGKTFVSLNIFPEVAIEHIQIKKGTMYVLTNPGVFKSHSPYKDFKLLSKDTLDRINTIGVSSSNPDLVYATSNIGFYKLEQDTFKKVIETGNDGIWWYRIFINPDNPENIFMDGGSEGGGTSSSLSYDGGKTFNLIDHDQKFNMTSNPYDPKVIYAISSGQTQEGNYIIQLLKSEDGGKTFKVVGKNLNELLSTQVLDLPIAFKDKKTLYAGVPDYGVYKSEDGGETFVPINDGLTSKDVKELKFNPKTKDLFMLTYSDGIFLLKDGSSSWVDISDGPPSKELIRTIEVDTETGEVFVGTSGYGIYKYAP